MFRLSVAGAILLLAGSLSFAQSPVSSPKPRVQKKGEVSATAIAAHRKRLEQHRDRELQRAQALRDRRLAKVRAQKPTDLAAQERRIETWYQGLVHRARQNYRDKVARLERRYGTGARPGDN